MLVLLTWMMHHPLVFLDVKPSKKIHFFFKMGKTVISIGNRKFSKFQMMKQTSPLNSSRKI